ncbi:MAG: sensor histidine kinase [Bryobacteraceae bacterium]
MHIALISRDESLQHLCHGVLATLPIRQWKLLTVSLDDPRPTADLYLWDWEPRMCVPEWIGEPMAAGKHMLLIDRAQARRVFDELPCSTVTLVLKPVNSDALRAFLEQAAKHHDSAGVRRDRDTILDCLLAATLRLQEYDQDRMNFLARAVHDFRTPLTAVNGYCGLLLSGQFGQLTAAQREVLERTLHSVRRLSRLATALFQWSTGARVGLQSQIREADIEECCRQALHEVRPLAGEKSISIDLDVQPPGQPLCFDPAQMEQLLVNLLENSCKFTPRGGDIQVRGYPAFWERRSTAVSCDSVLVERRRAASLRANAYRVEVSDNGMGVRPEHLQTIFKEYTSYGGRSDRSGSGLGLAICKRILAEHGGQIYAESGQQGVTFVFHLPFAEGEGDSSDAVRSGIHLVAETAGGVRG